MEELEQTAVLVLKPTKEFLDWINQLPQTTETLSLEDIHSDCTALLIPNFEDSEETLSFFETYYEEIFENELYFWCENEDLWPSNRTFDLFTHWFDCELHSNVYHLDNDFDEDFEDDLEENEEED